MISLNLGIDFGTKYTKVCVRDTDRDESWVVIPGKGKSYLEAALIVSQVGIRADGTLVAGLTELEWQREKASCEQIKVIDFLRCDSLTWILGDSINIGILQNYLTFKVTTFHHAMQ